MAERKRTDTAEELRAFTAAMTLTAPVFRMPRPDDVAKMLREDLNAAGIEYRDDGGRVFDFHGFRHSFLTNLAAGGVHPKTAQALARHCTIRLTMDRYSHSYRGDQSAALTVLPDSSEQAANVARATGTEDAKPAEKNLASCLAPKQRFGQIEVGAGGQSEPNAPTDVVGKKTHETSEKREFPAVADRRRRDSNPRDGKPPNGFQDRRLQPLGHSSKSLPIKNLRLTSSLVFLLTTAWHWCTPAL